MLFLSSLLQVGLLFPDFSSYGAPPEAWLVKRRSAPFQSHNCHLNFTFPITSFLPGWEQNDFLPLLFPLVMNIKHILEHNCKFLVKQTSKAICNTLGVPNSSRRSKSDFPELLAWLKSKQPASSIQPCDPDDKKNKCGRNSCTFSGMINLGWNFLK